MQVGEFCNREVVVINADEPLKIAAELMRKHHVGDVVLVEEHQDKRIPVGIITDRDLVLEIMAPSLSPKKLLARDIVTESLSIVYENDSIFEALDIMCSKGIRRLPVVNDSETLVGIITVDDMIDLLTEMLTNVVRVMKKQQKYETRKRL